MHRLNCSEAQDIAAELALGTISGDDRARILAHISTCAECRRLVDDMAGAADSLFLLAPEHEPPAGFESKVLGSMLAPSRRNRLRLLSAAAAIAVACVVGA